MDAVQLARVGVESAIGAPLKSPESKSPRPKKPAVKHHRKGA